MIRKEKTETLIPNKCVYSKTVNYLFKNEDPQDTQYIYCFWLQEIVSFCATLREKT